MNINDRVLDNGTSENVPHPADHGEDVVLLVYREDVVLIGTGYSLYESTSFCYGGPGGWMDEDDRECCRWQTTIEGCGLPVDSVFSWWLLRL